MSYKINKSEEEDTNDNAGFKQDSRKDCVEYSLKGENRYNIVEEYIDVDDIHSVDQVNAIVNTVEEKFLLLGTMLDRRVIDCIEVVKNKQIIAKYNKLPIPVVKAQPSFIVELIKNSQIPIKLEKSTIYNIFKLKELVKAYYTLPEHIERILKNIKREKYYSFHMFYTIYLKIRVCLLSKDFIYSFVNADIPNIKPNEKDIVHLIKAKELFRLYRNSSDPSKDKILKKVLQIASSKKKALFLKAKFSVFIFLKDFYSAITCSRGSIREYKALSYINKERAANALLEINASYKYSLLCAQLLFELKADKSMVESVYSNAFEKFKHPSIQLAHLRYLKMVDPQRAIKLKIESKVGNLDELIILEQSIILRKLKMNYMGFLYKNRINKPIIIQEIKYFENSSVLSTFEDSAAMGLHLIKYVFRRKDCSLGFKEDVRELALKHFENGDFLLVDFHINKDLNAIKSIYNQLDQKMGFYWVRLRNVLDFEERIRIGIEMIKSDYLCQD